MIGYILGLYYSVINIEFIVLMYGKYCYVL